MAFVLDNSVVSGWYLTGQSTDYSRAIAARLEVDKALVPALWQLELANVLKTACTKGRLSHPQARQILDALAQQGELAGCGLVSGHMLGLGWLAGGLNVAP